MKIPIYVESRLETQAAKVADQLRGMINIEDAMAYIEEHFKPGQNVTEHFVRELHTMTVCELEREGDAMPGAYSC